MSSKIIALLWTFVLRHKQIANSEITSETGYKESLKKKSVGKEHNLVQPIIPSKDLSVVNQLPLYGNLFS